MWTQIQLKINRKNIHSKRKITFQTFALYIMTKKYEKRKDDLETEWVFINYPKSSKTLN